MAPMATIAPTTAMMSDDHSEGPLAGRALPPPGLSVFTVAFAITFRLAVSQLWSSQDSLFILCAAAGSTYVLLRICAAGFTADIASRVSQEEVQWVQ